MKVAEILYNCELVYVDEHDNVLEESAIRAFKRSGMMLEPKYRCMAGPKAGKIVSHPGDCAHRKDPAKIRSGRKVMRQKGGIIHHKAAISKRKGISKTLVNINRRLSGKTAVQTTGKTAFAGGGVK